MDGTETIKEPLLRALIQTPVAVRAIIKGTAQGFTVVARIGDSDKRLETSRRRLRIFASLDTAALFVRDLGLQHFEVDMSEYRPGRLRKARPDRAEALRRTRTSMRQEALGI